MERREVLRKCLSGAALGLAPPRLLLGASAVPVGGSDFFCTLEDARISYAWMEHRRAFDLFQAASELLPHGRDSALRAEILESLDSLGSIIREAEDSMPAHRAAVRASPNRSEGRFWLGITLSRVGQADEALEIFHAILNYPNNGYWPKTWNEIGWDRYRRGLYDEALPWFKRVLERRQEKDLFESWVQNQERAEALESIILAQAAMGQVVETESEIRRYIRSFGRLPWAERRMLRQAGFDAEALYIEHRACTSS